MAIGTEPGHDHPHDHSHDHDQPDQHCHGQPRRHNRGISGSSWARLRHAASGLLGAHSHDPADQLDETLEGDARGRGALTTSLAVLASTALIQMAVVVASGSVALLGDTLHNVADALTAVPLLIAFRLARRPANSRYTYGYGRAEDLAGLFVIAMITLSSVLAAGAAIDRLIHPQPVRYLLPVAAAALAGFAGNEFVARLRVRVGREIGSAALVADGLHARTDGITSLAVLLGAGGVALGWRQADPVIGLVITVAILAVLRSAISQIGARLMDAVDPTLVEQARAAATSVEGIDTVRELRIRWLGHTLRAEVDATVGADLSLAEAHALAHHAEANLLARVPRLTAATVHTSPTGAHGTP
ncbi:MAG TPA: cation diffusion facilitator family transporter [Jatrophihabitantaceae bacterium]|nr:cation diffusion facilitator family transporter [Jatrophihabitantaceae bacterium]